MPNIKSAKKRVEVIKKKTMRNNSIKSGYKTAIKKAEAAIESKNPGWRCTRPYISPAVPPAARALPHLVHPRCRRNRFAPIPGHQLPEDRRAASGTPGHHDTVAAGLGKHLRRRWLTPRPHFR